MTTKWLPGGWSGSVGIAWLVCVLAFAWLMGRDPNLGGEGDGSSSTGTTALLLVASVSGLAVGVAMVRERHAWLIVPTVFGAALLGTVATSIANLLTGEAEADVLFALFVPFVVVLGVPVGVGALLGALWRLLQGLLDGRSTDR